MTRADKVHYGSFFDATGFRDAYELTLATAIFRTVFVVTGQAPSEAAVRRAVAALTEED